MIIIIKGIIIGIGKILPGISGSMLAINLGEYNRIIEAISNIQNSTKNKIIYLTKLGTGILLAITLLSKIIVKCINTNYFATMLLFIGMIIGNMPKQIITKKITKHQLITILLVSIIIAILLEFIIPNNKHHQNQQINKIEYNLIEYIKIAIIGAIDATTSIVPGISGTALLITFGYYDIIMKTISTILEYTQIKNNLSVIIPFCIGFISCIYFMSKIINKTQKKYPDKMNITIMILMTTTIYFLIKQIIISYKSFENIIQGIICLVIGTTVISYINKKNIKNIKE